MRGCPNGSAMSAAAFIRVHLRSFAASLPAFLALADAAQVFPRIDARVVAIAPIDADRVVPDGLYAEHLERRLVHLKRIGRLLGFRHARRSTVSAGAARTGAFVAQVRQPVLAAMAVFPVDLDALRFRNGNVLGIS